MNRLQKISEATGKITEYTYDKAGNRLTETVTNGAQKDTVKYEYNEQNRLTSTTKQVGTEKRTTKYNYDNNGNLIYQTEEITKKIVGNEIPKPHFGMFISGQSATQYAEELSKSTVYFTYDLFNQLITTTTGAQTVECKYNGEGLRVEKTVNGQTTRYLYEYDKIILEVDGKGKETARNALR